MAVRLAWQCSAYLAMRAALRCARRRCGQLGIVCCAARGHACCAGVRAAAVLRWGALGGGA
eukprot:gene21819-biopygen4167